MFHDAPLCETRFILRVNLTFENGFFFSAWKSISNCTEWVLDELNSKKMHLKIRQFIASNDGKKT